jgi:hypothetical protein
MDELLECLAKEYVYTINPLVVKLLGINVVLWVQTKKKAKKFQ